MRGVWGAGLAGLLCLATASLLLVRDSRTWGVASVTELVGSDHDQFFSISRELASIRQSKLGRGFGTAPSMAPSPPSRDEPTVREADAVAPHASLASLDRVAPPARQPESEREIETSIRATRGRKPAIISPRSPHGRARRAVKLLRAMRKEIGARVAGRSTSNAALRRELQKAMTLLRSKRGGRGRAELAHVGKRRVQKLGIVDDVTDALGFGPPPGEGEEENADASGDDGDAQAGDAADAAAEDADGDGGDDKADPDNADAAEDDEGGEAPDAITVDDYNNVNDCAQYMCGLDPPVNDKVAYTRWVEEQEGGGRRRRLLEEAEEAGGGEEEGGEDGEGSELSADIVNHCYLKIMFPAKLTTWRSLPACKAGEDQAAYDEEKEDARAERAALLTAAEKGERLPANFLEPAAIAGQGEKTVEAIPYEAEPVGSPDCNDLHVLPGVELLGSGYDPAMKTGCSFDDCATRPIVKYTYDECKTTHTPGGTYKVPDQITVVHIYETSATTKSYLTSSDYEKSVSAESGLSVSVEADVDGGFGSGSASSSASSNSQSTSSSKGSKQEHKAIRSIDVNLYALHLTVGKKSLREEFVEELEALPVAFSDMPHKYLEFMKRWGRFVVHAANYGGTVKLIMTFTSESSSSSDSSSSSFSAGVAASFDSITAGGSASASMSSSSSSSSAQSNLNENSEISLECSGGDPAIAAAISDFKPSADDSANFRNDLNTWLPSVPRFPALVTQVPRLMFLSDILPFGTFDEQKRRDSIKHAQAVIDTSPWTAMHSSEFQCKGQGLASVAAGSKNRPSFTYNDFNRITPGYCLSMRAQTSSGIYIALSTAPSQKDGRVFLKIGAKETTMFVWERTGMSEDEQIVGKWRSLLRSVEPAVLAVGASNLIGEYWICLNNEGEGPDEAEDEKEAAEADEKGEESEDKPIKSVLSFGIGRKEVSRITLKDPKYKPIFPSYFALGCESNADINSITITPFKDFQSYVKVRLGISSKCQPVVGCEEQESFEDGCGCKKCKGEMYEAVMKDGIIESCKNVGCQKDGIDMIPNCRQYKDKIIETTGQCECEICKNGFFDSTDQNPLPTTNYCAECSKQPDAVAGCKTFDSACRCQECSIGDHCKVAGTIDKDASADTSADVFGSCACKQCEGGWTNSGDGKELTCSIACENVPNCEAWEEGEDNCVCKQCKSGYVMGEDLNGAQTCRQLPWATENCANEYCNIYPALRDSFCPAEGCNGPDTASKCWNHYETRGKEEGKIYPCLQQCYLGYCNLYEDLRDAFCNKNACSAANAAQCTTHAWHRMPGGDTTHTEKRAWPCSGPNCPIRYCNMYQDLMNAFCGGQTCSSAAQAKKCVSHWGTNGHREGRVWPCQQTCGLQYCNMYPELGGPGKLKTTPAQDAECTKSFLEKGIFEGKKWPCLSPPNKDPKGRTGPPGLWKGKDRGDE